MKRRHLLVAASAAAATSTTSWASPGRVLGLSLPLTGVQAEVARDLALGYQLALDAASSDLTLMILDDESKPDLTAANIRRFASDRSVMVVSGIVGTPHAQAAIPLAHKAGLPVVGIRSGANVLRTGGPGVFHLRSSFEDELTKVVDQCKGAGFEKMVLLYSNDSFGTGSRDHMLKTMELAGMGVLASIPVERNGSNIASACDEAAKTLRASTVPTGVALLLIANPMVRAATELRQTHKIALPIFAMSFVATRDIATVPNAALAGLGVVDAFPIPWSSRLPLAMQFRANAVRMARPEALRSLTTFEGYFYGTVIAHARAASIGGGREALVKALHAGVSFDGISIRFDDKLVGHRFLEVVRKGTHDGLLRA